MTQKKHLHCHPTNKSDGTYWKIDFGTWGHHRSPLMGWGKATMDTWNDVSMSFGRLADAVAYAETMGWGYVVSYPTHRWHVKKNYSDNFKWKGPPPARHPYD